MVLAVIPARFASTRLPGKALADIGGVPMIVHVWRRVCAARGIDRVLVATDDPRIGSAVARVGAEVALTGPCVSGTDRVAEAARGSGARVVVNVQGDEPFIEPDDVSRVAAAVCEATPITTGVAPLTGDPADPARVKVVRDHAGRALFFSRLPIPLGGPWSLHVGLYAFDAAVLARLASLAPSALEGSERLEQLRWLEAGYSIGTVPVSGAALSVDTPADLDRARRLHATRVKDEEIRP